MHSYTYTLQCVALTTSTQGNVAYSPAIPYRRLVLLEGKCCFIKHKQYCIVVELYLPCIHGIYRPKWPDNLYIYIISLFLISKCMCSFKKGMWGIFFGRCHYFCYSFWLSNFGSLIYPSEGVRTCKHDCKSLLMHKYNYASLKRS